MGSEKPLAKTAQARRTGLLGLEFLKWVCFLGGIVGFIAWLGDIVYWATWGYTIHPIFEAKISSIPFVLVLFSGILLLGCLVAALEKNLEATSTSQGLQFGTIERDISEIHKFLFKTEEDLKAALDEAQESKENLEAQVHVLTREREKLSARLKTVEENLERALAPSLKDVKGIGPKMIDRLKKLGLEKVPDLLNMDPEELSSKLGVSRKVVDKWFDEAVRMSKTAAK